jgi:trehalose 6-phosphate phosphatase
MLHTLEHWPEIARRVRVAGSVALFMDFDGTLSPIVAQPEDALLERGTRVALLRLAGNPRVKAYVISGRRRTDLQARIAVPGLRYLGVQGWDTAGNNPAVPELLERIAKARDGLAARLNGTEYIQLEDKGVSFALHYRGAGDQIVRKVRALLREMLADYGETLRVLEGDRVWEVLPWEVRGKGYAARKHWQRWGSGVLPVYLGNDATDEAAFRTLARGVTVRVGPAQRSRAHYRLRNPSEVRRFLEMLEDELQFGS